MAFRDGAPIPRRYTCDGEDASPDLTWSGAPDGTQSLALIVTDPDAGGFVHWLIYDLTGTPSGGLPAGVASSPDGPPQGTNGFGRPGYGGPCPPSGTHHYTFVLYALDHALELPGSPRIGDIGAAMTDHVIAETRLTGTYQR
jgi:Raf kinase inhibitor-like YbhB/YbcL family protein